VLPRRAIEICSTRLPAFWHFAENQGHNVLASVADGTELDRRFPRARGDDVSRTVERSQLLKLIGVSDRLESLEGPL
jgi:hypothetical protein